MSLELAIAICSYRLSDSKWAAGSSQERPSEMRPSRAGMEIGPPVRANPDAGSGRFIPLTFRFVARISCSQKIAHNT